MSRTAKPLAWRWMQAAALWQPHRGQSSDSGSPWLPGDPRHGRLIHFRCTELCHAWVPPAQHMARKGPSLKHSSAWSSLNSEYGVEELGSSEIPFPRLWPHGNTPGMVHVLLRSSLVVPENLPCSVVLAHYAQGLGRFRRASFCEKLRSLWLRCACVDALCPTARSPRQCR